MPLPFQVRNHHGAMEQPRLPPARVSMFRRLLVRVSAAGRLAGDGKERDRDERQPSGEAEAVSAGLDRMVLSFMEDAAAATASMGAEQNHLADASRIAERCHKGGRKKTDVRRAVADGLRALGYDAAVCKSRWEKTTTYPACEHEYIDAVVEAGATWLIVELDFRSEFEVARSTKAYRAALQATTTAATTRILTHPPGVQTSRSQGRNTGNLLNPRKENKKRNRRDFTPSQPAESMPHGHTRQDPSSNGKEKKERKNERTPRSEIQS